MVSFHQLYERHSRQVFRFALFLSGNVATAEDLTSETFVRAWTARGTIREGTVAAYLLTITRNLWRDSQRRDWRTVPLEAVDEPARDGGADALVDLTWTERQLAQLAAGDREALLLHARDGLSYDEVAHQLGVSLGAVKSRIFRARHALAALRQNGPSKGESS
jgi:RNA polymerase sigma-70 factor (ECF subfamily)